MGTVIEEKKEKRSFGSKFVHFLMYGGFCLIIFGAAVIYILIIYTYQLLNEVTTRMRRG